MTRRVHLLVDGRALVRAEIAQSPREIEQGLMRRTSMAEDEGMLFVLPERRQAAFWMRNVLFPLDMIFIDDDVIVGVVENAAPLNDVPRMVSLPSTHVLEVNGGWCRWHGVGPGQRALVLGGLS